MSCRGKVSRCLRSFINRLQAVSSLYDGVYFRAYVRPQEQNTHRLERARLSADGRNCVEKATLRSEQPEQQTPPDRPTAGPN